MGLDEIAEVDERLVKGRQLLCMEQISKWSLVQGEVGWVED